MKLVKLTGLAALLALAGAAIVVIAGIGSASADEDGGDSEIVLCKINLALCTPEAEVWAAGKGMTGTALNKVKFLGAVTIECNQSKIKGEAVEKMEVELTYRITEREIKECSNEESACPWTVQFESLTSARFKVAAGDQYSLELDPRVRIKCGAAFFCVYAPEKTVALPVDDPTNTGKPLVLAQEVQLTFLEGSFKACEKKVLWDATYELVGGALSIRLSLFQL
jgi:hypothetical protein